MSKARGIAVVLGIVLSATGCAATQVAPGPASSTSSKASAGSELEPPWARAVSSVDDPNAVSIASTIRRVTVYSDRALVSRRGAIELTAAPAVYAFRQLPGWVDEGSVRVATSAGRIIDVQVVRGYLARATEPRFVKAEVEARELDERLHALDDELEVLEAQAKQVEDIKAFSLERLNQEVASGGARAEGTAPGGSVAVGTYEGVVDFIAKKLREIRKARRRVQAERQELVPQIDAKQKLLEELRASTQLEETRVLVTVQGGAPADAELELTYLLPGATWEAAHEVRAQQGDPAAVEVTSYAVVTQASGEDWDNAELTFSTQSSSAAVRIPELDALTLGDTPARTQTIEARSASFQRAEAAFQGQNRLWNRRFQGIDSSRKFEESYQANFESLKFTQSKTVQIFQSLERRGTSSQFRAVSHTRVRADGRSVRVPIGRATLKARKAIVAAPEQSLNAVQTLEMRNESGQPILPGSVALYQGGAFLGMTSLDFVADGEEFDLFLSVADQLKISRVLDKKRSALVRKQRTQMQLAFVVTVENLSSQSVPLELADRIPVSEDRDIVISNVKVSPDAKPDSRGILRFPLTLQPKEKKKLEIQYQIEYPPSLVVEMRRSPNGSAPMPAPPPPASAPFLPAPRKSYDLREDILHLEDAF